MCSECQNIMNLFILYYETFLTKYCPLSSICTWMKTGWLSAGCRDFLRFWGSRTEDTISLPGRSSGSGTDTEIIQILLFVCVLSVNPIAWWRHDSESFSFVIVTPLMRVNSSNALTHIRQGYSAGIWVILRQRYLNTIKFTGTWPQQNRWNLRVPDLYMRCRGLTIWQGTRIVVPVILPLRSTSISGRPKESILLGSGLAVLTSVTICTALSVASVSLSRAVFVSALVSDSRESRPSVDRYTPCNRNHIRSLWNHTSSNGIISHVIGPSWGNPPPVTGVFLSQRPVMRSVDVFLDLRPNAPNYYLNLYADLLWNRYRGIIFY